VLIVPAIDLRAGRVVRLAQGDYDRQTDFAFDPVELAQRCADAGARWLHVVDLEGARSGSPENLHVIEAIARTPLRVQAGGGVRTTEDVQRLFAAGVARVVVGSVAVRVPELVDAWLAEFGADRVCVALDARRDDAGIWRLPVRGWTEDSGRTLDEMALRHARAGVRHVLCTDIDRDGMLSGPNLDLYAHLRDVAPALQLQASGGIRSLADLCDLRERGAAAAILGRSLLEGRFTLEEALRC
jgi:phosphoribosylformimino-5-aminoimidazole carboxamide ribotide isomerase